MRSASSTLCCLLCCLLCVLGYLCAIPTCALGQFLQTDLFTYQLPDAEREVAVILTPKGIFIAHSQNRSSALASFDPEQLLASSSTSIFISYANQTQVPEQIVLAGQGNHFRIRGTFTVNLSDSLRVAVAMNTSGTPYVTIVSTTKGRESILGFIGQQPVVNLAGEQAIDLLEADPLRRKYGNVAAPYEVRPDNRLYLLNNPVAPQSAIGLLSPPDNPCLLEGAKLLWEATLPNPQNKSNKEKSERLQLSSLLLLNISAELLVGIHFDSGQFVSISQAGEEVKKTCIVKPLPLKRRLL